MALGRRNREQQQTLWVATEKLATAPRHAFYERLNRLLTEAGFDKWLETRCRRYYSQDGRPSIPPGVFFRMVFIGYFENIDSQRGIAWRCSDSLSLMTGKPTAPEKPETESRASEHSPADQPESEPAHRALREPVARSVPAAQAWRPFGAAAGPAFRRGAD